MKEKSSKMSKRASPVGRRAWNVLRIALLWARKGGVFRDRLVLSSNIFQKGIKKLHRHSHDHPQRGALVYGERELSFDDTPVIHVRMHRPSSLRFKMPHIPCIKPHVDFDYDFEFDEDDDSYDDQDCVKETSALKGTNDEEDKEDGKELEEEETSGASEEEEEEEEIDAKAEEFIAKFYQQMKLQRQISYLQYKETINRGSCK